MWIRLSKGLAIAGMAVTLAACGNGGHVALSSGGPSNVNNKGSPYAQVTQGGASLVVQVGQTAQTGVHGWVSIQAASPQNIKDPASGVQVQTNGNALSR